jgi:hypothetical protein
LDGCDASFQAVVEPSYVFVITEDTHCAITEFCIRSTRRTRLFFALPMLNAPKVQA